MSRSALPSRRSRTSCSILALATVLVVGASPAAAQSLQGTGSFNSGGGSITTGVNTTNISIDSAQAVIDWTPSDNNVGNFGAINFQPSGTTATFNGTSGDFAVLNRVNVADPSRIVAMNGTINSTIGNEVIGGSIYFYSPSGFVMTGSSVVNVGSLVLSASPISVDGNGNFLSNGTVVFGQAPNPAAQIVTVSDINGTSQINALNEGSYVAMVAPRVEHHGTINVNGGAALVGAEAATMTFRTSGLFDIQVDVGTTDANGVYTDGTITGPASSGAGDNHRIYAVAVPKNTALTMLIANGSDLGFDIAGAADVVGHAVVLSAGHDVSFGSTNFSPSATAGAAANIDLGNLNVTSALNGESSGSIRFMPSGSATFASDVTVHAAEQIFVGTQSAGAVFDVAGNLSLSTDAFGSGAGSAAFAGDIQLINSFGGTINVAGNAFLSANGHGGSTESSGFPGGDGTGGSVVVSAVSGGTIDFSSDLVMSATGSGGSGESGGDGFGGLISLFANGGDISVGGTATSDSSGQGGYGFAGNGGDAVGGTSSISASGVGTLTVASSTSIYSAGTGGSSDSGGAASGNGTGGAVNITASGGGAVSLQGVFASATGYGGFTGFGVNGGNGAGGSVSVSASGGNSAVGIAGNANLSANGEAGSGGECISCGGIGGDGTGGTVSLSGSGGTNNIIDVDGDLFLSANGYGGVGVTGPGGIGTGGNASIDAQTGLVVDVAFRAFVDALGYGGDDFGGTSGGDGIGGSAQIGASGGALAIGETAFIDASGLGGNNFGEITGGIGGDGFGGNARIIASAGTIDISDSAFAEAQGIGGTAFGGTGGDGFGGTAEVNSNGGSIHVVGNLIVRGGATGGDGDIGGNATARVSSPPFETDPSAAILVVSGGGSIEVDGGTGLDASATGGAGADGAGGNAMAGEVDVIGYVGSITLESLVATADATGGAGGIGGAGGLGQGGVIDVAFGFGDAPINSTISAAGAFLSAEGRGGAGGAGFDANTGGNGGAGGNGLGGDIFLVGSAGGGTLVVGDSTLLAGGYGGTGGNGGNGDSGAGGNGGTGGLGDGGDIQTGTLSTELAPTSGGGATYGDLFADAGAIGGAGGNGGTGGGGDGTGGNGGNAVGGNVSFLARGVAVSANGVFLRSSATGGNGGTGSIEGSGGDASTGFLAVESKDRFGHPTQRGTLTANIITGVATAAGGAGGVAGDSIMRGGNYFRVLNGDAAIGSVSLTFSGATYDGTFGPDLVSVRDGTATITGAFAYSTPGELALDSNNGSMTASSLVLTAGNFVADTFNPAPTSPGTYFADSATITTGNNFVTTSNIDVVQDFSLTAPGQIQAGNIAGDGLIDLWAQGGLIDVGGIDSGTSLRLLAGGGIDTNDILAGTTVNIEAQGGSIGLGNMSAGGEVIINAAGSATTLDVLSGGSVDIVAGPLIDAGNLSAAGFIALAADTILAGNLTAGGFVDLFAGGPATINVGDLSGDGVYATSIGDIVTGTIDSTLDVDLVSYDGSITTADIEAATSIFADARGGSLTLGILTGQNADLDAATSITAGNVLLSGGLTADALDGSLTFGNIDVGSSLALQSAVDISAGTIDSGGAVSLGATGNISTSHITAGGTVDATAASTALGNVIGTSLNLVGANGLTAGDLTASDGDIALAATTGSIQFGDAAASTSLQTFAGGGITGGSVTAGQDILAESGADMTLADLSAGNNVDLDSGGSMFLGNVTATLGSVQASAVDTLSFTSINAGTFVTIDPTEIVGGDVTALAGDVNLTGDSIAIGNVDASDNVLLTALAGDLSTGTIGAGFDVTLDATGAVTTGDITAGGLIDASGASLALGNLSANSVALTATLTDLAIGNLSISGDVALDSIGDLSFGDLNAFSVDLAAGGSINGGAVDSATDITALAGSDISLGDLESGGFFIESFLFGDITLTAGEAISTGLLSAFGAIDMAANGGPLQFGDASALLDFTGTAAGAVAAGNVTASVITLDGNGVTTGDLTADNDVIVDSGASMSLGNVSAQLGSVQASAVDVLSFLDISAGTFVTIDPTDIVGGDITALAGDVSATGDSIAIGNVNAWDNVFLTALAGDLSTGTIQAGIDVFLDATGMIATGGIAGPGTVDANGGSLALGNINSNLIDLTSTVGGISTGDLVAFNDVLVSSAGFLSVGNVVAANADLAAAGGIGFASILASGFVDLNADGSIGGGNVDAGGILADSGGNIFLGDLTADGDIDLLAASEIFYGSAISGQSIDFDAGGYIDGGDLTAGDSVDVHAGDWVDIGGVSAGLVNPSSSEGAEYIVNILAGTTISTLNIEAASHIGLAAQGDIGTGDIDAGGIVLGLGGGDMTFGSIDAGQQVYLADYSMMALGGEITGTFDPQPILDADPVASGGSILAGNVNSVGPVQMAAGSGIGVGNIISGDFVELGAGGSVSFASILASGFVDVLAGGSISGGNIDAGSWIIGDSGSSIFLGDLTAEDDIELLASGSIFFGEATSGEAIRFDSGGYIDGDDLTAGDSVDLAATWLVSVGDVSAGLVNQSSAEGAQYAVDIQSGGPITTGAIEAFDSVELFAVGGIATGNITAGDYIDVVTESGIATGDLTAETEVDLEAGGDISFANVDADSLDFDATGSVTGGDIVAFSQVGGEAEGAITLGNITAGPGLPQPDDFSVGIASATSITVGNVSGTDRVGFATLGDLSTGNLTAGNLIMALVGGDISVGSLTTTAPGGEVYMADSQMFLDAGGGDDEFDASLVLALDPLPTGGSITIDGPVSTGLFQAAAGTGLTTGGIDADTIEASAGGTATLNGVWSGQDILLSSNDIDIATEGGISTGPSGLVRLISTNATQALIGDGLTGSGYALSNAEFGRVEGGSVYILARGDASAAQDMLIGDLAVTGPSAGSTIESSTGILVFATGDVDTLTPGGVIRVVGNVDATGFGSGNAIEFHTGRFELDAATGSISITSSGGPLSGEIGLYADQIHVASADILDQLAVDPQYDGYQEDLNAPAAVQRPEGVLNAATIWIESDNLQNILIQNTGTEETPAGFLAQEIFVNDDFEVAGPPGSIDVVVNGQLQTEGGTLAGVAVRDALVEGENLTPFTANSTINGCLLAGPCGQVEPGVPILPPGVEVVDSLIDLIGNDPLGEGEFGNESFIDDLFDDGGNDATNPIEAPQPLFDTGPLDPNTEVNDPVSGTGNPALLSDGGASCDTENETQCDAPPVNNGEGQ